MLGIPYTLINNGPNWPSNKLLIIIIDRILSEGYFQEHVFFPTKNQFVMESIMKYVS